MQSRPRCRRRHRAQTDRRRRRLRRRYRRRWAHSLRDLRRRPTVSGAGSSEHASRIILVEQHSADRIFAHRADAVGEHQPALVQLDGRAAIADLDEFPRIFGFEQQRAALPFVERIRPQQEQVLAVLPTDHAILPADLAREQRHALVAPTLPVIGVSVKSRKSPVRSSSDADVTPAIGGVGADPFAVATRHA